MSADARRSTIAWASALRRPPGWTPALARRAIASAYAVGGEAAPRGPLSIVIVDDAELARLHGEWLGDPSRTDVITFDLREAAGDTGGSTPVGELYISVERAYAVARRRRADPLRELLLYVVHGALHLCGYDDAEPRERRRMRAAERRALAALPLTRRTR